MRKSCWPIAVSAAVLFVGAAPARAGVAIEAIALSDATIREFGSQPSINKGGAVAFTAFLRSFDQAIFTGSGGDLTPIVDSTGPFREFGFGPAINDAGRLAIFAVTDRNVVGIYRADAPGALVKVADSRGPYGNLSGLPSIDSGGGVAFASSLLAGGNGIFLRRGGTTRTLITSNAFLGNPSLSDDGTVAFLAGIGGGGIFATDGTTLVTVADSSGPFGDGFGDLPDINDAREVAFRANLDDGEQGVFVRSGDQTITYVDSTGPFAGFNAASINNRGQVAFLAAIDAGGAGIFVGPDPATDAIVRTGDPLAGSTVLSLEFGRDGLNDSGQVAFFALLSDGRQGIFRASITPDTP